jgi:hypothetical protein
MFVVTGTTYASHFYSLHKILKLSFLKSLVLPESSSDYTVSTLIIIMMMITEKQEK